MYFRYLIQFIFDVNNATEKKKYQNLYIKVTKKDFCRSSLTIWTMKKVVILVMFKRMRTMLILLVTTFQIVTQIVMIKLILNNNTPVVAAVIDDLTPAHNQIFSDLDKVLNLDNYDPLAVQEYSKFEYSNSSKSFQVE